MRLKPVLARAARGRKCSRGAEPLTASRRWAPLLHCRTVKAQARRAASRRTRAPPYPGAVSLVATEEIGGELHYRCPVGLKT
jgi:hypothetical protein